MVPLVALTLFTSAFLLFWCQPMVGKMVLPLLGGAASVWTTCIVFFQAMLLLGYVYAHLLARVAIRMQILVHILVTLSPLIFLPIQFSGVAEQGSLAHPAVWLLGQLLVSVGVPFVVVSTTAPLLQNWISHSRAASGRDPYFLYSASNAGSLLGLVIYPFLVEPRLGASAQSRVWGAGYLVLVAFIAIVASALWTKSTRQTLESAPAVAPTRSARFKWIAAAFVPSALMLSVTSHITANLASAPFLWVAPLAVYLLTFILAFAPGLAVTSGRISRIIPVILLAIFPFVAADVVAPPGLNWILIAAHLVLLYCAALLCHTVLAEGRPHPRYLTEFYFWVALAGMAGGIFAGLISPMIFNTVLEYPLLIATLPLFRSFSIRSAVSDWKAPAVFAAAILVVWLVFRATDVDSDYEVLAFAHSAFVFACYKFKDQTHRFAIAFASLILAYAMVLPGYIDGANRLYVARNFFGVKKVLQDSDGRFRRLKHGDTLHGVEATTPEGAGKPISYYHPTGPVGDVLKMFTDRSGEQKVAVIGLGSGSMAAYGGAQRSVTFFEIDPAVESVARTYFTFLPSCGPNCRVVVGDGRLELARAPDGGFDLLMLDAFSSDSIPAHLLSKEAFQLYISKLAPGGVLLCHVSNRYLKVDQLVSALLADSGLIAFSRFDEAGALRAEGKSNSSYVVAARSVNDLGSISESSGWQKVDRPPDFIPWTDDYSNLFSLIRWY